MYRWIPLTIAAVMTVTSQTGEPIDSQAIAKIRAEGLERSQAPAFFQTLVTTIGPRLAGSPEYKRSAEWARDQLTKFGLSNARLEPFEFGRGWVLDKLTIEMIEPRYMPLIGYAAAWTASTPGEVVAPVVVVTDKTAEQIAAMPIKGAAVMQSALVTNFIATDRAQPATAPPAPPAAPGQARGGNRGAGGGGRGAGAGGPTPLQAIQAGGATVLLQPSRGMHGTVFVQVGRDNPSDVLPRIVLAGEHYNMVMRLAQSGASVKLRVNVQTRFLTDDRNTYNVIAELPGSDPALRNEVVMLGAHLDSNHTGTGATDNADGVAAVMEALRIIKAAGLQPKRTLRIALWAAEEEGLLGSRAWVQQHLPPTDRKENVSIYFNIDPGKGPIYGWYLENNEAAKPIFDAWMAPFGDLGVLKNVPQGIGSTDHLSFINAGVPGFNPIQDYVDYDVREHHTNMDVAERVKENDLKQNAVILASVIYHAANRRDPVPSPVRK
jgi:hypothetical protein